MRSGPLGHHDVRTCIAQRLRPPGRVLVEERLQRAGDEVRARKRARHHARRSVASAGRGAEDRTVDLRVPEPEGEGQLSTGRDTEHRGAFGGQRDSETRPRPSADLPDEERLVCREPFRAESR